MKYKVTRNNKFDFHGQSYASSYPNLHRYPATMIPQIGIEIFKELGINKGNLLDPYCGSGSSFIVGLDRGLKEMEGFDINPLAILISAAKFTKVELKDLNVVAEKMKSKLFELSWKSEEKLDYKIPKITNIEYWFSKDVIRELSVIKNLIDKISNKSFRISFLVPFSETVRECSYTRNGEFKLFRMKEKDLHDFYPKTFDIYVSKLNKAIYTYEKYYYPLVDNAKIHLGFKKFPKKENYYDIVLTSPPYGDSRTTVAYGQFSILTNEWLGIEYARKVDTMLMGGKAVKEKYQRGLIAEYINEIAKVSFKKALEVSSFYFDLESSIKDVASSVRKGGRIIYIIGNRTVKDICLPTDQFIAEKFEENGFKHLFTYERNLGNKSMPVLNSPTNVSGVKRATMTKEYIIVCEKPKFEEVLYVSDKRVGYKRRGKARKASRVVIKRRKGAHKKK
jgi:hypothetical protein